jgi:hypothetical protein
MRPNGWVLSSAGMVVRENLRDLCSLAFRAECSHPCSDPLVKMVYIVKGDARTITVEL